MKLNLTATNKQEEIILTYLEENASETLVEKINNGTSYEKDGKPLINKKTLSGFMKYACEEARKLSAKGATSACVKDEIVFGWAMHYFEEADIIGTLYNEDGTEYKSAPKKNTSNVQRTPAPAIQAKSTPPLTQFNLFDMMQKAEEPKPEEVAKKGIEEPVEELQDNIEHTAKLNVDMETGEILSSVPKLNEKETIPLQQASPLYQKYMRFQNEYPHAVIAYRLGDFFEVFGDNAVKLANRFDLTLTGRDCGLPERVPMIGFPYHASDIYFHKIAELYNLIVVQDNVATPYSDTEISVEKENKPTMYEDNDESDDVKIVTNKKNEPTMYENNDENEDFKEELSLQCFFDKTALLTLYELFDYELDMQ